MAETRTRFVEPWGGACTAQLWLSSPHPPRVRPGAAGLTRGCPAGGGRTGQHWLAWPDPPRRPAGSRSAGGGPRVGCSPGVALGQPGAGRCPGPRPLVPLTSCFSGRSFRSCLRTSTSNLVVSPARIMATTSSLELGREVGGRGRLRAPPSAFSGLCQPGMALGPRRLCWPPPGFLPACLPQAAWPAGVRTILLVNLSAGTLDHRPIPPVPLHGASKAPKP